MVVLVTGGAGYIGSHVSRALRKAGHDVIILDNLSTGHIEFTKGFEFIKANISDLLVLENVMPRIDAIVHLAAKASVQDSVEYPNTYFQNNVSDALDFLESVIDHSVTKFIFSSSCAVYGVPGMFPITEAAPQQPISPYGISKLFFEQALNSYDRAYGLRSVSLRYFNAVGADESGEIGELHDPETHLIPLALTAASQGIKNVPFQIFGTDYITHDGTCIRDYVHVCDIADAHVKALEYLNRGGKSIALNLGNGRGDSVIDMLRIVESVTGNIVIRKYAPRREGDPPKLVADASRAREVLGWEPTRSLYDAVSSAWKWSQICATR